MGTSLRFDSLAHSRAFRLGRAAHFRRMQRDAADRRRRLVALVQSGQYEPKASQALAEALGCGRSTVWRDLQVLDLDTGRCLHCGQLLPAALELAIADATKD